MKALRFYGASDDLIEVEGDVQGADEYNGQVARFQIAGLFVEVEFGGGGRFNTGCWGITVMQEDEDVPVTAENLALTVSVRESRGDIPARQGYSMVLSMDVPDDCELVYLGGDDG